MSIDAATVKKLREQTGAGMMDCKRALEQTNGDFAKATDLLRQKGVAVAEKRQDRVASEGIIETYIHTGGQIGVMLELGCETPFVAKNDDFKELAHKLAMHIAWANPEFKDRSDIPEEAVQHERSIHETWAKEQGKPEAAIPRIVEGRMEKFFSERVFLDQPFIQDEDVSVKDLITQVVGKIGEKIEVKRYIRWRVGEDAAAGSDGEAA